MGRLTAFRDCWRRAIWLSPMTPRQFWRVSRAFISGLRRESRFGLLAGPHSSVKTFVRYRGGVWAGRLPNSHRGPPPTPRTATGRPTLLLWSAAGDRTEHARPSAPLFSFGSKGRPTRSGLESRGTGGRFDAHVPAPLHLWDVWSAFAATPVAFEAPSAGYALNWKMLEQLRVRKVRFTTLTHAAGISSTGDPRLDAQLPFGEAYRIPESTCRLVRETRRSGGRVLAVGTTVVRASGARRRESRRICDLASIGERVRDRSHHSRQELAAVDGISHRRTRPGWHPLQSAPRVRQRGQPSECDTKDGQPGLSVTRIRRLHGAVVTKGAPTADAGPRRNRSRLTKQSSRLGTDRR